MSSEFTGQLLGSDNVKTFLFGGHARFTLVSKKTGTRFTYRLSLPKAQPDSKYPAPDPVFGPFFLKVLTGPDNSNDFQFAGTVRRDSLARLVFTPSAKSRIGVDAPSVSAFVWFAANLDGNALGACEFYHDGSCGRCGRDLTVPESVATGLGPVCAGRV